MFTGYSYPHAKSADLTADPKLVSLLSVIANMETEIVTTQDKEVVLIIGATGAGKSTFINYLANRPMELDTTQMEDAIVCKNPLAAIGHGMTSCTDKPQLYAHTNFVLCDCPGFFDNRGIAVEVANAIGIQSLAKKSKKVKGIILIIDRSSITSTRGQGIELAIEQTLKFLGPDMTKHLDSFMLLISKVPNQKIESFYSTISNEAQRFPLCSQLLKHNHLGFYSPLDDLDNNKSAVLNRNTILNKIAGFRGIPNSGQAFNIAISPSAELEVTGLMNLVGAKIRNHLKNSEFEPIPRLITVIESLNRLNIASIEKEAEKLSSMVMDQIKIFEFEENGKKNLEMLKKIMPPEFQPIIQQTLQSLEKRLKKEQEAEQEKKKTEQKLQESKQNIDRLQGEQTKLHQALQEAQISQQEFEQRNRHLQEKMDKAQNDYRNSEQRIHSLASELNVAREESRRRENEFKKKLEEAEHKSNERIGELQSKLDNSRRSGTREPTFIIVARPVVGYSPFGGGLPFNPCFRN